jgi:CRP-like cAMP-binding protein
VRQISRGTRIFWAGEPAHNLFFLATGMVKLTDVSTVGDELIVRLCQDGEIFGESCFLQAAQQHCATAIEHSEVLELPARQVIEQVHGRPDTLLELLGELSGRLAATDGELQALASETVVVRLGARLLALAEALETESDWLDLRHGFRHQELAEMMGVQRETVTRAIGSLRKLGLVATAGRGPIRIHRAQMRRFLGEDLAEPHIGRRAPQVIALKHSPMTPATATSSCPSLDQL